MRDQSNNWGDGSALGRDPSWCPSPPIVATPNRQTRVRRHLVAAVIAVALVAATTVREDVVDAIERGIGRILLNRERRPALPPAYRFAGPLTLHPEPGGSRSPERPHVVFGDATAVERVGGPRGRDGISGL